MVRPLAFLSLCLGLALAGCTPPASEWTPAEAPKDIHVDYVRLQHVASFAPNSSKLSTDEAGKLSYFLDTAEVTPQDHVYFEPSASDRLATARIAQLAHSLSRRGLGATTLPAAAVTSPNHMNIYVERYVVTPPDCPNWTKPATGDHSNTTSSNFGCADATNLGLMVADPRDLVVGRHLDPASGDAALAGVARYRTGNVQSLTPSSASTTYATPSGGGGGGGNGGGNGGSGQ
jgi:pilus assembly protein CpaD